MKNKVILITSRFGILSDIFKLWWNSAARNTQLDFLILTDIDNIKTADNIYIKKYSNYSEFIRNVESKIGYKTDISTFYKCADLRPAYADIFQNEIKEVYKLKYKNNGKYDFWGYVDTDMILGNVGKFITDDILEQCDVFQTWGHFMLVRNTYGINNLYKTKYKNFNFRKSLKLPENRMNEEGPFILQLANAGYRIDSKVSRIADIRRDIFEFSLTTNNYEHQRFAYKDGKILRFYFNTKDEISSDEFMYIHFMKRKIDNIPIGKNNLLLTENGFFELNRDKIFDDYFSVQAYENWQMLTKDNNDARHRRVSYWYKLTHFNNTIYRRMIRKIELEKNDFIKKYYEQ